MLGPDVADQPGDLLVHDHEGRVEPSPVAESSQLKLVEQNIVFRLKSKYWVLGKTK